MNQPPRRSSDGRRWFRWTFCAFAIALGLFGIAGCAWTSTDIHLDSILRHQTMRPDFVVRTYMPGDNDTTADIFLSDIPAERLVDPADSLADAVGSIVHIRLFLIPSAGSTPIDATACNATVRQVVLAGPHAGWATIGVYGGGGFLLPDGSPGRRSFSGDVFDATLKLTHQSAGFVDRVGAGRMSGSFSARRDDALARAIGQRVDALIAAAEITP